MDNRRYTIETTIAMKFYQLPKVFFTNATYKKLSNNAKIMYVLLADRLQLSIKNKWVNETGEVYFVFPVSKLCDLMGLSNKTIIKVKKELIESELLQEEQTGRANRMYLMIPRVEESDVYQIYEQENNLDFGSEILEKNDDGKTRSVNSTLQADSRNEDFTLQDNSRSEDFTFQVETALNQQFDQKCKKVISGENQKCNSYTSEVEKLHPNDTDLKETEEEDIKLNIKTPAREGNQSDQMTNQLTDQQQAIKDVLTQTRLFKQSDIQDILHELSNDLTLDLVNEQLDSMRGIKRLFDPKAYFIHGVKKLIDFNEFKAQSQSQTQSDKPKILPRIPIYDWTEEVEA